MTSKGIRNLRVVESNPPPTPEPGPPPTDTPESEAAPSVSVANKSAVLQAMVDECNQLANALAGYGVDLHDTIDPRQIRPRVESFSACRMLINKGICTEEEMQLIQVESQRELLRGILQAAENQRHEQLQRMRDVVVPENPGLIVAKH